MQVDIPRAAGSRRRGVGIVAAGTVIVVVCMCVSLLSAAVFAFSPSRSDPASAPFLPVQPGAIAWNGRQPIKMLVLLSGESQRTDSATIVSFQPATSSLHLLSLPRNLWVTVPGVGQTQLGDVPSTSGIGTTLSVVERATHLAIPYYMVIGAQALMRLVDTLGGISTAGRTGRPLDGRGAAQFIAGSSIKSETMRMRRAQLLLGAINARLLQPSEIFQIPTLVNALGGLIPTNFPYRRIPLLEHELMSVRPGSARCGFLGPGSPTLTPYWGDGQEVALGNWPVIARVARTILGIPAPTARVSVLNGSGVAGQAAALAGWLRGGGVTVSNVGSAARFTYAHTEVAISPAAPRPIKQAARDMAQMLGGAGVTTEGGIPMRTVRITIGADFQDPTQQ